MGKQSALENRFRRRIKEERERRGWSQTELLKRLESKGIHFSYPSVIAKIEAGERGVGIDEAAAMASLFGVSVDSLMGRRVGAENDLVYSLRGAISAAKLAGAQVEAIRGDLIERLEQDLSTIDFDGRPKVEEDAAAALAALGEAVAALERIAHFKLPSATAVTLRINRMFDAALERVLSDQKLVSPDAPEYQQTTPPTKKSKKGAKK